MILNHEPLGLSISDLKNGHLTIELSGRLDNRTAGPVWEKTIAQVQSPLVKELTIEADKIQYCDMTGIGLIHSLRMLQGAKGGRAVIRGLSPDYQNLLDLVERRAGKSKPTSPKKANLTWIESFGKSIDRFLSDLYEQIVFIGSLTSQSVYALCNPRTVRWRDVWVFIEKSGANAMLLVIMAGFLIGVIMAFQSAVPLKQMGSDVFVANVVAFAVLRELGPLITAIILAGRTGAAIAAEIGTMQINEEINALTTMGLEPVRFLVISRMLGILLIAPMLTILADFFGMIGGAVVFHSFGYSIVTYTNQITATVDLGDLLGGIFKAVPFSLAIGSIACLRGLRTKTGAAAVGESTTSAVVSGMVLIIVLDGIISAIYFVLGI